MTFSLTPLEIKDYIVSFIQPTKITNQEIKNCGRIILNLSLVCKEFKAICEKKIKDLKKINELVVKYPIYNSEYENPRKFYWGMTESTYNSLPGGNPQLLDALFSSCNLPFAKHTFSEYTSEVEEDIKKIVKLTPQSINCILGELRCRIFVPPLAAACINAKIPVQTVEFLLKNGANPNTTYELNGQSIHLLKDTKSNVDTERFLALETIFKKFGVNPDYMK